MRFDPRDETWAKVARFCNERAAELLEELASKGHNHSPELDAGRREAYHAFREVLALADEEKRT